MAIDEYGQIIRRTNRKTSYETTDNSPHKDKNQTSKARGVSLELDPETGELVGVADSNQKDVENEKKQQIIKSKEYILHSENKHMPEKVNLELGEEQYVDDNLQKIRELRKKQKNENVDYLAGKQNFISRGLEEIDLSKNDMGKTGNSLTGTVSDKDKEVSDSQIEDAKFQMLLRLKEKIKIK